MTEHSLTPTFDPTKPQEILEDNLASSDLLPCTTHWTYEKWDFCVILQWKQNIGVEVILYGMWQCSSAATVLILTGRAKQTQN